MDAPVALYNKQNENQTSMDIHNSVSAGQSKQSVTLRTVLFFLKEKIPQFYEEHNT